MIETSQLDNKQIVRLQETSKSILTASGAFITVIILVIGNLETIGETERILFFLVILFGAVSFISSLYILNELPDKKTITQTDFKYSKDIQFFGMVLMLFALIGLVSTIMK